ncbi:putative quinol monooxygenase [Streptomyces sp. B21-102]|uniref:putative quinol monooxygenase n=1 Tax=unclassified Streptomyces TaxID=2593676 RepID=UPI002FF3B15D
MLIVLSRARAADGARERLMSAAVDMARASRDDNGCLGYSFAADLEDPAQITCTEIWADRAALDAHMAHDHTGEFLTRVWGLTDGDPVMSFHATGD